MTQIHSIAKTFRVLKEISKEIKSIDINTIIENPIKVKKQLKKWQIELKDLKGHIIHSTISPFSIRMKYDSEQRDIDQLRQIRSFEREETQRNAAIDQLKSSIIALRIAEGIIDEYVPIIKRIKDIENFKKYEAYTKSRLALIKNLPIEGEYLRIIRELLNKNERKCIQTILHLLAETQKNETRLAIIKVIHSKNGTQKISTVAITIPKNFKRKIDKIIKANFGQNARVLRIRFYKTQRALVHNKYSRTALAISYCKTFSEKYEPDTIKHILIWDIIRHYILNSKRTRERYSGQFPYLASVPTDEMKNLLKEHLGNTKIKIIPYELNINSLLLKLHLEEKYDADLRKIHIFKDPTLGLISIYLTTNNDINELLKVYQISKDEFNDTLFKLRLLGFPTSFLNIDYEKLPKFDIKTSLAKQVIKAIKDYASKKHSADYKKIENYESENISQIYQIIVNNRDELLAALENQKDHSFENIYISIRPTVEILFVLANEFPNLKRIYCPTGKFKELSKAVIQIANLANIKILPLHKPKGRSQKYSDETVKKIKEQYNSGKSVSEISQSFDIPIRTIYHIIKKKNT